jgi:hypothetical protein
MPTVELVYDPECPNVSRTRVHLTEALTRAGLVPQWSEHDVNEPSIPPHARGCGSPTVLVDGRDIVEILDMDPCAGARCRLYRDDEGRSQVDRQAHRDALAIGQKASLDPALAAIGVPCRQPNHPVRHRIWP